MSSSPAGAPPSGPPGTSGPGAEAAFPASFVRLAGTHMIRVTLRDGWLGLTRGFLHGGEFRPDGSAFTVRADRAEDLRLAIAEVTGSAETPA